MLLVHQLYKYNDCSSDSANSVEASFKSLSVVLGIPQQL